MTSLIEQIKKDFMAARLVGEKEKSLLLSTVYGEIIHNESSKKLNPNGLPMEEITLKVLNTFVKNNKETIELLKKTNLSPVALETENVILEVYLPKQLSEAELVAAIAAIITGVEATSPKDMGKVMKELKKGYGGMYDGKLASKIVREELT
jgi:uncharacterized protein